MTHRRPYTPHRCLTVSAALFGGLVMPLLYPQLNLAENNIRQIEHYTDRPDVRDFVTTMNRKHGLTKSAVMSVLRKAKRRQDVLDLLNKPAEKTLRWDQYSAIFLKPERVDDGTVWRKKYRSMLDRIERRWGVSRDIILAIVGIETFFGRYMGKFPVFESLTTLAFEENRRQSFFRRELEEFFLLVKEQRLNPLRLKGSYAGALGLGQFIPSSYRFYAVNFDKNRSVDLIRSKADALASIANYLAEHGWSHELGVAWPVQLARPMNDQQRERWLKTQKPKDTLDKWLSRAVIEPASLPADLMQRRDLPLSMIYLPTKSGGEHWLTSKNFYAVTRYNHSNLYAMAVFELSRLIRQKAP